MVFDAYTNFRIKSVEVNANGAGLRQFALRDANQNVIETKSVYCPNGINRVNIDFDVPVGSNLQLVALGDPQLYRTNVASFLNYPYTFDGVCSIVGSSVTDNPINYYYYFYKWEVITFACESAYAIMEITAEDCSQTNVNQQTNNTIKLHPNPANNYLFIDGLNLNDSYSIDISDMNGRIIISKIEFNGNAINLENLESGVYLVKIQSDKNTSFHKFIKL